LQVLDFNKTSGVLSNGLNINKRNAWGVEFSPNGKLLYVSSFNNPTYHIYQYNLLAGSETDIENSKHQIYQDVFSSLGVQLGPDQKIVFYKPVF
jgi:Tol biopolymer transport system component